MKNLILVICLFCFCNFAIFADTLTVYNLAEALNYSGDKNAITALVVQGPIEGNDYSPESQWSKFRTLDSIFPNISEVTILTDQDIPDFDWNWDWDGYGGLFLKAFDNGSLFLKKFSAPNTKKVGVYSFGFCYNLTSVNLESTITLEIAAFQSCKSLTSIYLPVIQKIGDGAFALCESLILDTIKLGTKLTTPTIIAFGVWVFGSPLFELPTEDADLLLGEHARPEHEGNTWQRDRPAPMIYYEPYIWRSITIKKLA